MRRRPRGPAAPLPQPLHLLPGAAALRLCAPLPRGAPGSGAMVRSNSPTCSWARTCRRTALQRPPAGPEASSSGSPPSSALFPARDAAVFKAHHTTYRPHFLPSSARPCHIILLSAIAICNSSMIIPSCPPSQFFARPQPTLLRESVCLPFFFYSRTFARSTPVFFLPASPVPSFASVNNKGVPFCINLNLFANKTKNNVRTSVHARTSVACCPDRLPCSVTWEISHPAGAAPQR